MKSECVEDVLRDLLRTSWVSQSKSGSFGLVLRHTILHAFGLGLH